MAENNSNALIEALEEVMRGFNSKINEQFGDNFKQLNEAVGQILVWQEQYQSQMTQLAEEFSKVLCVAIWPRGVVCVGTVDCYSISGGVRLKKHLYHLVV